MIFDTHAHYDDEQFDGDREALLSSMEMEASEPLSTSALPTSPAAGY